MSIRAKGPGGWRRRQRRAAWLFLLPSLAGVCFFTGLPFLDVIRRSFCDALGKGWVGTANYQTVLNNGAFRLAAGNMVHFLAVCIPFLAVISLSLSVLVYRNDTKYGLFKTSLILPMVIPTAAMVLVWRILFCQEGVLNQVLSKVTGSTWEVDWVYAETAFPVLVCTYLWKNVGYDMLLWLAGLNAISESLYDAAKVDGAGRLAQLWYITLPGLKGTMGLVLILSVVNSFRVYREAYLLSGSYPDQSIYMIPHLFGHWFLTVDVQKMSTAAVIMTGAFLAAAGAAGSVKFVLGKLHGGDA